jgi:hypothetical protein
VSEALPLPAFLTQFSTSEYVLKTPYFLKKPLKWAFFGVNPPAVLRLFAGSRVPSTVPHGWWIFVAKGL